MRPTVIGIGGGTGAGKTYLTNKLVEIYSEKNIAIINQDSYYKDLSYMPYEERIKQNFDHPDSIDIGLFKSQLEQLINGKAIEMPTYDFSGHKRSITTRHIPYSSIIIVEGIFVLYYLPLCKLYTIRVFIDASEDIRFKRRVDRDIKERGRTKEAVKTQYQSTVQPMHKKFVEPSKNNADLIVKGEYRLRDVVDKINTKINFKNDPNSP